MKTKEVHNKTLPVGKPIIIDSNGWAWSFSTKKRLKALGDTSKDGGFDCSDVFAAIKLLNNLGYIYHKIP